jgi:hypothetical protein
MSKFCIILIIFIFIFFIIFTFRYFKKEKYTKLRDIGKFPLNFIKKKSLKNTKKTRNKYSGHRYNQSRRYNFLSQQNNKFF